MRRNEQYIPAPMRNAAALTVQSPDAHHRHVDERLGGTLLVDDPRRGKHGRGDEEGDYEGIAPALACALADRDE